MIDLLQRLRRAEAASTGVLDDRSAELLEWDRVTAQLARHCLSGRAAAAVRARRPSADPASLRLHRDLADELRPLAPGDRWPPLINLDTALDLLEQDPPLRLEGPDLVQVAASAAELDALRTHLTAARGECPLWGEAAVQMATFTGLCSSLGRALDRDGRIVDGASPLLARLRRTIGDRERAVRSEVAGAMVAAKNQGWTTGNEAALCGDRFCLPLRAGDSRRVPGIVHDRSQSGATLFVEPASVVRLANELAGARLEMAAEEARILFELNRAVEQARPALVQAAEVMIAVDAARAHLLWSREVGGRCPRVEAGAALRVCAGRHPLLMEVLGGGDLAAGRERVVPLDLEMPAGRRALVVSGPNAGGKSVALKTIGLLGMLAQCGWDVPAREDTRLPLVERLLLDLGDDQSIAASLSSFSAHLGHLARFLAEAGPHTLVLCDEIGSGTDPQEGTALAFAVLEELAARGALVLASTHFGLLKAAVHDDPHMVNAAMDYDEDDLAPLFTVRVGDPGTSHAFDIAARMGLPPDVLARARAGAGEERVQIERLLADLDRRARDLATTEATLARERDEHVARNEELAGRLKGLDKERREVLARARTEGEDVVRQGRRAIEQAVREIRSGGGDAATVQSARRRLEDFRQELPPTVPPPATDFVPTPGQRVRIPHLGLVGRVQEVRGDRVIADADGLRLSLGLDTVAPLEGEDAAAPPPADHRPVDAGGWNWQGEPPRVGPEIDLRGERAEEGWQQLDRLIDRALPAGLTSLLVIHGLGTGRLRDHLHACLRADPRVAAFREAGPGQGGGGATHVDLQAD